MDIILTIPANNVYIQTFNVPNIGGDDLAEAADLNLRMVSPIDINTAYYGWQNTSSGFNVLADQSELLAAFIDRKISDDYVKAVQEAGYSIAAVESSTLSLSRSLYSNKLLKTETPYLIIQLESYGIYFVILRNHSVAFSFFSPWATAQGQGQAISLDNIKNLVEVEVRRLFNFYSSHWGGQINNIALITPALQNELSAAIKTSFPSITVEVINDETASAVFGAALRGIVPRSRDRDISLNDVTAHEAYRGGQIFQYLELWRTVTIALFATLLIIFLGSDLYLRNVYGDESKSVGASLKQTETAQLTILQNSANQFNGMVASISTVQNDQTRVSWLVDDINVAASVDNVSLSRVSLQVQSQSGLIIGDAESEVVATDFKNKVSAIPQLDQVQMPFSSISLGADGLVNFTITFHVSGWAVPQGTYTPPTAAAAAPSSAPTVLDNTFSATNTANIGQQLVGITQAIPNANPNVTPIIISNLQFTSISAPITVQVSAVDQAAAVIFNDALGNSSSFHSIKTSPGYVTSGGRVVYSITFTYSP